MRVISVAGVIRAEVAEAEAVEVPTVSWITERTEIGIVRRNDGHSAAGANEAMELLHGLHHIGDVLDHMDGPQRVEGLVAKRIREMVEIRDHVRACTGVAVKSDGAGVFVDSTADVEDALGHYCTSLAGFPVTIGR